MGTFLWIIQESGSGGRDVFFFPSPFPFALCAHFHIPTRVPRLSPVHAPGSASRKPVQDAASGLEDGFVTTRKSGENKTMKYLHCYVRTSGYSFISQPDSGYIAGYFILPRWRFRGRLVLIGTLAKTKASVSPQFSPWLYFLTPAFLLVAVSPRAWNGIVILTKICLVNVVILSVCVDLSYEWLLKRNQVLSSNADQSLDLGKD